jgi:hypothetical protein
VLKDLKVPEAFIVEDHKAMCSIANILCAARHMQELGLSRAVVIAQDAQSEKIPTIGAAVAGPDYTFNTFIVPSDTPFTPKERANYVANGRGITKYVARDTVPGNPDTMDIIWDRLQTFEAYGGSVTQNQLLTAAEPYIAAERLIYAREHPAALLPLAA